MVALLSRLQRKRQSSHVAAAAKILNGKAKGRQPRTLRTKKTIWCQALKRVAQRKLNQPRRADGRENLPERPRIFNIVDGRVRKVCVVPDIEEIRREANGLLFCQFEVLDEREVPILLERSTVDVAPE